MPPFDPPLSRRRFLQVALSGAGALAVGCDLGAVSIPEFPFTLGVASGDPLPDRVVLWTRLAPEPFAPLGGLPDEPIPVYWELAHDEAFRSVVRVGGAVAHPSLGHSVHVDVNGLVPDRWYWYRFHAGGHTSPVGRTRTFPAPDAAPALLRFASASCQNYQSGFYTAHAALADEDLDFVAFLGDYIYEGGVGGGVRQHDGPRITTLEGYRNRYALYRGDPNLQAAHARFPWIVTWDDHEVTNNYAGLEALGGGAAFEALRAAGYQAWYEHMPVRLLPPKDAFFPIFRSLDFGDLARVNVLDTRQYRTDQECGDATLTPPCEGFPSPDGDMLGPVQEAWLQQRLLGSAAIWNVLAQQVILAPTPLGSALNYDQWDGYPVARARLVDFLAQNAIRNPVVLTGDIHAAGAGYVPADLVGFTQPLAAEWVATGISSSGLDPGTANLARLAFESLPQIKYFDGVQRGYVRHVVTRDTWQADFRFVSTTAEPVATVSTGASWAVGEGNPEPQPA